MLSPWFTICQHGQGDDGDDVGDGDSYDDTGGYGEYDDNDETIKVVNMRVAANDDGDYKDDGRSTHIALPRTRIFNNMSSYAGEYIAHVCTNVNHVWCMRPTEVKCAPFQLKRSDYCQPGDT